MAGAGVLVALPALAADGVGLPEFTEPPRSVDVPLGEVLRLSATVEGTAPLAFAWWKDGEFLPGANASSLTISNAQVSDAGHYALVAVNGAGVTMSKKARVMVFTNSPISYPPAWVALPTEPESLCVEARVMGMALDSQGSVLATTLHCAGMLAGEFITRKFAADGRLIWAARFAGESPEDIYPTALAIDGKDNVYVAGLRRWPLEMGPGRESILIKLDSAGRLLWERRATNQTLPGNPGQYGRDVSPALAVAKDGIAYLTAHPHTIAYDADGRELWTNQISGAAVKLSKDEAALFIVGSAGSYLTKATTDGEPKWTIGIPAWAGGVYPQVSVDGAGCVIVSGTIDRYDLLLGRGDIRVMKIDPDGNVLWERDFDGPGQRADLATALCLDSVGDVYVAGETRAAGASVPSVDEPNHLDIVVLKYSSNGVPLWTKYYNSPRQGREAAYAMRADNSGSVFLAGQASYQTPSREGFNLSGLVLKLTGVDGRLLWTSIFPRQSPVNDYSFLLHLEVGDDGQVFVGGMMENPTRDRPNKEQFLLARFDAELRVAMNGIVAPGVRQGVVAGPRGRSVSIEGSFDFENWQVVDTVLNTDGLARFFDRDDGERLFPLATTKLPADDN